MSISVLILTLNEEENLQRCLDSLRWSDDVVVFDSFSSDRTVEIAKAAGTRVVQRAFDNECNHRTASLKVGFKYPWVFNPDADEVATPELIEEMRRVVQDKDRPEVAYRVRFKTMFMDRWIKHSSLYPTWVVRLFRPEAISFERTINLRYVVSGPKGRLEHHFEHYSFNKGLNAWFDKHNRYSWQEAEESLKSLAQGGFSFGDLLSREPATRRRALKELSFRLPFRPLLRFLYMYFVRLGFLDGLPGYHYCRLLAIYEYMIVLKMKEIQRRQRGLRF
jgi:glycosyltransferase involved in cell wall biosynthesis